ncbi:APC family permease [Rickettsiales bacterium LUAb2]
MSTKNTPQINSLFSIIAIGVTSIIGSGWLFSAYYTAQFAGSMSILSWILGASFALLLALMLAEIATMFPVKGLTARLLSLSHNKDYGFVISSTNWLSTILIIPSEAQATVQYVSYLYPNLQTTIMTNGSLNILGLLFVAFLIIIYGIINYWGVKTLSKVTNILFVFKLLVPLISAIVLICTSFHVSNFTSYHNTFAPYGISSAFTAIITGGIFYSFLGFGSITTFAAEVKNPKRNIPIALFASIMICLVVYLLLQVAFIGSIPTNMITNGWHNINFSSPIVQLVLLFNLHFLSIVLYIDAVVSPSGTAITYTGSAGRTLTGMAHDNQMPKFFSNVHEKFNISRRSLVTSVLACFVVLLFFKSWHAIMIVISAFQLLTCAAIPLALAKFRDTHPDQERSFKLCFGKTISFIVFNVINYFMIQTGFKALLFTLLCHVIIFIIYIFSNYKNNIKKHINAFLSAWSIFLYLAIITIFGYLNDKNLVANALHLIIFFIISSVLYFIMLNQKDKQTDN